MFSLPASTEVKRQIAKRLIYQKFDKELSGDRKTQFDADISKIVILNEISPVSVNVPEGEKVRAIYMVQVVVKSKDYNERNLTLLSKLFGQNMIFAIQFGDEYQLAIYQTKLLKSDWQKDEVSLTLSGLNLDTVWEGLVSQISGIYTDSETTLDEQIALSEKKKQLTKKIADLEAKARKEQQSKKKYELHNQIKMLKKQLEEM